MTGSQRDGAITPDAVAGSRELTEPRWSGGGPVWSEVSEERSPTVAHGWASWVAETAERCNVVVAPADGSGTQVAVSHADFAWDPAWSPDGGLLAWHEWDLPNMPWDGSRIVVGEWSAGVLAGRRVVAGGDGEAVGQPRFSPDGSELGFVSDRSGWMNVWIAAPEGSRARPVLAEPSEHAEPSWSPAQRSWAWSPDGRSIAFCRNERGYGRLVIVDVVTGSARDIGKGWHRGLDWAEGGLLALRTGARTPPQVVLVDPATGEREVLAVALDIDRDALTEPDLFEYTSNGVQVPAIFHRPPGIARPPLLAIVHGGPIAQARVDWDARVAYFVSRGWAVLQPNFRGSTGYGRAYWQLLRGGWGDIDTVDVAGGIEHVIAEGWCDPNRVAVMGGSSGGMTALLLAAHHPHLVHAVVDRYGVADLAQLDAATHRFESGSTEWLAGPRSGWAKRSPLTHAASGAAPTLVLQGSDDPVVPRAQSDALVAALRAAGVEVEYVVYEGEGHGFKHPDTLTDELNRTEAFLARHLPPP